MDLLRLLLVYEDRLLYEPTAAQMLQGKRVFNPSPMTVMLSGTSTSVSHATAALTVSVAPAVTGGSGTLSGLTR